MHQIKTICVCGAGTMGTGIAQMSAQAGYKTILFDLNDTIIDKSKNKIDHSWARMVLKNTITATDQQLFQQRIIYTSIIQDCQADLIIEAIIEKASAKINLFKQLSVINSINTIFVSNTSSISINTIAQKLEDPLRFAGMHFFNPAPVMKLVELIQGDQTSEMVIKVLKEVCQKMNKTSVVCKDVPGFIVNRVARHYYLESLNMLEDGFTNFEAIDQVMESCGFKMGPFKLMDLIGIDINYSVSKIIWEELGNPKRLKPSAIQEQKIVSAELGRKTGRGFYEYPEVKSEK